MNTLPETGYLRLPQIIGRSAKTGTTTSRRKNPQDAIPALIPISKSAWWQGVKDGKYPQPLKLSERVTVWKVEDIRNFIENPCCKFAKSVEVSR